MKTQKNVKLKISIVTRDSIHTVRVLVMRKRLEAKFLAPEPLQYTYTSPSKKTHETGTLRYVDR